MQSAIGLLVFLAALLPFAVALWRFVSSPTLRAVYRRNVASYFSGVIGYLFIVVFVVAASLLAFSQRFFTDNLANLDQLSEVFPILLLFLVPAITMAAWADERKLGTEELLFTLPASDFDILIGKYLSVLSVYTAVLAFSVTDLLFLEWIGNPDWGALGTTYLGYWFAGAGLLGAGMLMSAITGSTTVAFVLGAVVCAIPVFIAAAPRSFFGLFELPQEALTALSVSENLRDFTLGVIPADGMFYFASLCVFTLYLNYIVIRRRHWAADVSALMGVQYTLRAVSLATILVALNVLANYGTMRADLTGERLYTLTDATRSLLDEIDPNQPVQIQAFVSEEVPREFVPVRKRLLGLLRQYDQLGGQKVDVRFVSVEPFSAEVEEAEQLGIEPQRVVSERDGRQTEEDIYLGVFFTSPYDEETISRVGPGSKLEYELTRTLGTVANKERLTVGVLETDAGVIGGQNEWQIVEELKLQYNVEAVSPDAEIDEEKYDVLMAVMPSSLTQPQMDNFVTYVKSGKPVLVFDDPFPMTLNGGGFVTVAPRLSKPTPGGPFNRQQQPPEPKADDGTLATLMRTLKLSWTHDSILWDRYNPHPEFGTRIPLEYVFVKNRRENPAALSDDSPATTGLEEVLVAYPGEVQNTKGAEHQFTPLLVSGANSGLLQWEDLFESSFNPFTFQPAQRLKQDVTYVMDGDVHAIAAHIQPAEGEEGPNVIFVADADCVADWFFQMRLQESAFEFDNVSFVLNAVDILAGQDEFVAVRSRRAKQRTLTKVEDRTATFYDDLQQNKERVESELDEQLEERRETFAKRKELVEQDDDLDPRQKQQQLALLASEEQLKMEVFEENARRDAKRENEKLQAKTLRDIRKTEELFWLVAILAPPLPAVLLGLIVSIVRVTSERQTVDPDRLRRD
ncbi:Gldg family protein [Stratiformator vulcanicus]|uniref:ABC-type uncharacterized transport system n=1 Tax=Stratiformator vulcanicus TaxID=2527980 RepID=A0A517R3U6_9PLAN|nr:Gldg family protein [Stratiformator vulcanicus]QDT38513.1 ABC-type uncharacterized transport system [Stratiformator vulcanicus]